MEENWFDDILLAAKEESGRYFVWSSETIFDYLDPLGYKCNRQYKGGSPPGSTEGVINAIDDGVIIANHRDHGSSLNDPDMSSTGWSAPHFTTDHIIDDIDNGEMYPIMFSLNCESGWFDGETDTNTEHNYESIGEVGLRVANKGFVSVIAATRVSYSGYNDELCRGFYDGMFPDFDPDYPDDESTNPYDTEVYRISQVMNYGKFWMYDKYIVPGGCPPYPWPPSESASRTEFEMFHVHGDPTMEVWTWMPENLDVSYEILTGEIEVTVECDGDPIENALVCVCQENGIYLKGLTDDTGCVTLIVNNPSVEEITLTVIAHNCLYDQQTFYWNRPPEQPSKPSGPETGEIGGEYEFSASTTDPESEQISYWFDWGDGTNSSWIGPYGSGETGIASHIWNERGCFDVKVKAKDINDGESEWSEEAKIWISNEPPNLPRIKGPIIIDPGVPQEFTFSATEPDGDQVHIVVMWGDSGSGSWEGPLNSGEEIKLTHTWDDPLTKYIIRAKAKDNFGYESDWAKHTIFTPRTRGVFFEMLERLAYNFPILNHLLEMLFF